MIIRLVAHLLLLLSLASGYTLRGSVILPQDSQPQVNKLGDVFTPPVPPSTRVEVVGQQQERDTPNRIVKQSTYVHADGGFVFRNITEGSYLVKVLSIEYPTFTPVRVDISARDGVIVSLAGAGITQVGSVTASSARLPYPIQFVARTSVKATYLTKPQGFQITSMLKNPMVLAAIVGGFVVFVMPKFTDGLDLAELQQEIKKEEEQKKLKEKK